MRAKIIALAAGLLACATPNPTPAQPEVPARWGGYSVELVDEGGRVLPTFEHRGRSYVLGHLGQRYLLRVNNGSGRRIEVVASVDGRDVVDGSPAAWGKRGYVVDPYGSVSIDGFRLSQEAVAAFRFSSVSRSYAARKGDARDVGVIGVAVFPERAPVYVPPPPEPQPYVPYGSAPGARDESARASAEPGAAHKAESPSSGAASAERLARRDAEAKRRPGLGTEFGEERGSLVHEVAFERASGRPDAVLTLRYDDRRGLAALGIDVDRSRWAEGEDALRREEARPFRSNAGFAEPPAGWRR
jgi:hypothetical protein